MKIFRLFTMLMLGIMLNVNLTSCSKVDIVPEGGQVVHPNGIPSDIPNNIIYYITSDNDIVRFQNEDVFGGAKIVSNTYSSTKGYGTIEFASEVTAIEQAAFKNQSTLTYIVWPNSVTSIGFLAFYNCTGLTSVSIGNSVESIEHNAFYGCSGLTSVSIGNSVESIEQGAFYGCDGLTSVTIPNSVKSIGESAFWYCSGLTSIVVEEGNSVYDSRNNCNAIIETESNILLQGCNTTIIPNSVTSIGDGAFAFCNGLTSVTIPNSVTSIGDRAFWDCSGFTSVSIGNSVTSIGSEAFYGCLEQKDVYCYAENVPTAYSYPYPNSIAYAFDNYSIAKATLHVPAASIDSYKATEPWSSFGKIVALTE